MRQSLGAAVACSDGESEEQAVMGGEPIAQALSFELEDMSQSQGM